jgi:cytochrome P450
MGRGLLLNEGPSWQRQRRKVRWAMQQLAPDAQTQAVSSYARLALERYCRCGTDLAEAFAWLAFALNARLLLGDEADQVVDGLHQAACERHDIGIRDLTRWWLAPDWLPLRSKARLRAAMRHYDAVLLSAAERRAASPQGDLLSLMLRAHDRQGGSRGCLRARPATRRRTCSWEAKRPSRPR